MKFTFDGHEYTLIDGNVFDSGGELVCTVRLDVSGEYWIVVGADESGGYVQHINECNELDAIKSFISSTY